MPSAMWPYVLLSLASVFLGAVSQIILKKAAMKPHKNLVEEYLNAPVIIAYLIFFITTVLGVLAYQGLPLSLGPVLETSGYVYITIFGVFIFKEKLNFRKILALLIIIGGIIVFSYG